MADVSIHAIIVVTSTVIGSFFLFRYILRRKKSIKLEEHARRIRRDGVEFTSEEVSLGFDPKMVRKDGRMPCCVTADWTHPDSGQVHQIKSQWFWYDPRRKDKRIDFKNVKGHVLPEDPAQAVMDLDEYEVATFLH